MEVKEAGSFKRKQNKISIDVYVDNGLTTSSCYRILEEILKYLLYQRHQIPVQYEVLLKDVEQEDQLKAEATGATPDISIPNEDDGLGTATSQVVKEEKSVTTTEDQYFIKVHHTKEEILGQKRQRKKKQYLLKLKKFIEDFKKVTQILRLELETGDVTAVNFVLGNSVTLGCEVYSVSLPSDFCTLQKTTYSDRHAMMQFFRAFVTNDDILKCMSRPCSIKKLWVMFEKKNINVAPSYGNWFSNTTNIKSSAIPDNVNCCIIPRPCFQPNYRSQVVQITIHMPALETPMDLTPTVGNGLIQYVCFSSETSSNKAASEGICATPLHNETHKLERQDGELFSKACERYHFRRKTLVHENHASPCLNYPAFCPCTPTVETRSSNKHQEAIVETPTVSSTLSTINISSVNSPSRFLVTKIDKFNLSDNEIDNVNMSDKSEIVDSKEGRMWYLIDQCIKGFKYKF